MTSPFKKILLLGNVATGKSTLMDVLAKELPAHPIPADELYKVNPFLPLAVEDRKRWSFTSDVWFLHERVKIARELNQLNKKNHLVIDSGIPMSYVYAYSRLQSGTMTQDEWQLYEKIFTELTLDLPQPNLVIYLHAPISLLLKRIKKRGREFEIKHHSQQYLESLQNSLEIVKTQLQEQKIPVLEINSQELNFASDHNVLTQMVKKIEVLLQKEKV